MPKTSYWPAREFQKIAEEIIPLYHQHLIDCSVKLVYSFMDKVPKSNGKELWAKVDIVTGYNAYLANQENDADPFFSLKIPQPIWEMLSTSEQKRAFVDWVLCHCDARVDDSDDDNPIKLSRRPYDIQDYSCIARRHGCWREEVHDFISGALASQKNVAGVEGIQPLEEN